MIGDIVESIDHGTDPPRQGRVVDTFYGNGEGGIHVMFEGYGISWCWFARYRVVTRWYLLLDEAPMNQRLEAPVRFPETFCSQCGKSCGPGNWGFSHCEDHEEETRETHGNAQRGVPSLTT